MTQEERSSATVRELLNDLSLAQTVRFSTQSKYAVHGLESLVWMAALVGISSIVFLIFLICLNHIFVPSEKLAAPSEKESKEKTPSWVADLIILSSFIIAITTSTLVAIILRWKRLKKDIPPVSQNKGKAMETVGPFEEHEIHFGRRPNFEGSILFSVFLKFLQNLCFYTSSVLSRGRVLTLW